MGPCGLPFGAVAVRAWRSFPVAVKNEDHDKRMTLVDQLESIARLLRSRQSTRPDGLPYNSIYDFVLKHGQPFNGQPLPACFRRGGFKLCFANSARMAERHRELTYVEGFAHAPLLQGEPVHHAWCVDRNGLVYDRTWAFEPEREYLGIPFKLSLVRQLIRLSGEYSVLDRWEADCLFFLQHPEQYLAS